ncbi:TPA: fimbria/pilus periplasmic chaperone [Escherichia coli]|nr:fimbria/pilus periplasmic chaperone [Escherichia coli]
MINYLILCVCCLASSNILASTKGVAIDPLIIKIAKNGSAKFNLLNDTTQQFIAIIKIIDTNNENIPTPFVASMPVQILKENSNVSLKIFSLKKECNALNNKYYLSVTFIPKSEKEEYRSFIPIVLTQQVPIEIVNPK